MCLVLLSRMGCDELDIRVFTVVDYDKVSIDDFHTCLKQVEAN